MALASGDFYRPSHARIYEVLGRLFIEGVAIDLVTVCDALAKKHQLEEVGGRLYLVSLMEACATDKNVGYHCKIVKEKSQLRQLADLGLRLTSDAYADDGKKVIDIVSQAGEGLFALVRGDADGHRRTGRLDFDRYIGKHLGVGGLSWGLEKMDEMTGGMSPGDLAILAGLEKQGKTALAMHIARHNAKQEKKILFFSLEMSAMALTQRIVASEARASSLHLKIGRLTNEEAFAVGNFDKSEAMRLIRENFLVDDRPFRLISKTFPATVRLYTKEYKIDMIILDYVDLFAGYEVKDQNEAYLLFKAIAKEYNVPFLVVATRNRPPRGESDRHPQSSDLRIAGEYHCDFLVFMFNPASHLLDQPTMGMSARDLGLKHDWENRVRVILKYDRAGGGKGSFDLYFDRNCGWFGDLEKTERSEPSF